MINLGLVQPPGIKRRPLTFTLTNVTAANLSTVYETSVIPIGYSGNITAYGLEIADAFWNVTKVRKNDTGSWVYSIRLSPGDLLNVQVTSNSTFNTLSKHRVVIENVIFPWENTTMTNPNLSFTNITNAFRSTVYTQSSVNNSNAQQTISITDGQISNNNSTWGSSAVVAAGATFWVRQTSSASRGTITTATISISALSLNYNWSVTTTVVTPGSISYTANGSFTVPPYNTLIVTMWGAGGQGAGEIWSQWGGIVASGNNGSNTTFLDLNAGGGFGGIGDGRLAHQSEGGFGGTATGGDINTEGNRGDDFVNGWNSPWTYAPNAGANTVGAGSSGLYYQNSDPPTEYTMAAGGSGAYVRKTYTDGGPLLEGQIVPFVIGRCLYRTTNNPGATGRIDISWS